jgi:hypothetical protein
LKGISYDLNNTIDWKKGVFQAGAYYGTENPQRPHTSHGETSTGKESMEVKPVRIKICHGIPVYVIKKDTL